MTGAGSGIGRAACLAWARRGLAVAALDIDADAAKAVAEESIAAGALGAVGVGCDVSAEQSVRDAFDVAVDSTGPVHSVFANAGIELNALLHDFDLDSFRRVVDVNLIGVFLTCREALCRLVRSETGGSIVGTSSPAALVGFAGGGNSAYAASKGGVSAFLRSAALDYAGHGIRVNAVVPGATETAMLVTALPANERAAAMERIRVRAAEQIPLGRLASPDEVAAAVVWLLSDDASYVTGSQLVCDGGLLAKSANDF